tara:strand:+ start:353 stop:655 length:303 start_codon:yes stop_codon:yes gene_type:complete
MKITEELLQDMILQEYSTVSGKDQINRKNIQYRTEPFHRLTQAAFENLDRMEDSIRASGDLEQMDLNGLKNNELTRLRDKISFIESMIDAKLSGKMDDPE